MYNIPITLNIIIFLLKTVSYKINDMQCKQKKNYYVTM